MSNPRVGLIGLGAMGQNHARILSNLEGINFTIACDPIVEDSRKAFGRKIIKTLDEFLDVGIDYAIVATPTSTHLEIGVALAQRGVHTLFEKPLAIDVVSCMKLEEIYRMKGLIGAVGQIERYNPAAQEAKNKIELLGEIRLVSTKRQGQNSKRINDVGVIKDLATHDIDLTQWLTGSTYSNIAAQSLYLSSNRNEDLVVAIGKLRNKAIFNHMVNWISPKKERTIVLTGENGALLIDTLDVELQFYNFNKIKSEWSDLERLRGQSQGEVIKYSLIKKEPLQLEHENFRDYFFGKNSQIVTLKEGLQVIEVAEAWINSHDLNSFITF